MSTPLISVAQLAASVDDRDLLIVDCRFDLSDTSAGAREFAVGHIPHAVYAHLDDDLSDPTRSGQGRHPLASEAAFSKLLSRWGVRANTAIVCYDAGNASIAGRLWWMLRAAGQANVHVLDGGIAAWVAAGLPLQTEVDVRLETQVEVTFDPRFFVSFDEIEANRGDTGVLLVDARAAPRYRGEVEPIDPVAGHVPGAINRPFADNLLSDGRFKSAQQLRVEFDHLLAGRAANDAAMMCGSGVSACHNLLAMHHAGIEGARLFVPSWSGWISDPRRSIALGA